MKLDPKNGDPEGTTKIRKAPLGAECGTCRRAGMSLIVYKTFSEAQHHTTPQRDTQTLFTCLPAAAN